MKEIAILDLGINNIKSIKYAFERLSIAPKVISDLESLDGFAAVILPGIGNFGRAAEKLMRIDAKSRLTKFVEEKKYVVGICLGMQLLGDISEESDGPGLGLIPGKNVRLPSEENLRIPNIGWNPAKYSDSDLDLDSKFETFKKERDFYFVHSYHFIPKDPSHILATTHYGDFRFASAIQKDNVIGFQFHPEKSSNAGRQLLQEVLEHINERS